MIKFDRGTFMCSFDIRIAALLEEMIDVFTQTLHDMKTLELRKGIFVKRLRLATSYVEFNVNG